MSFKLFCFCAVSQRLSINGWCISILFVWITDRGTILLSSADNNLLINGAATNLDEIRQVGVEGKSGQMKVSCG